MKNNKDYVAFLAHINRHNLGEIMESFGLIALATGVVIRRFSHNKNVLFCNKDVWMKLVDAVKK